MLQTELTDEKSYLPSIGSIRLRLQELQEINSEAQKSRQKHGYQEIDGVLYYQGLFFASKAIRMKLISRHYDDPRADHFGIEKTHKLLAKKYYWPTFCHNVKAYVKGYDVCLASKAIRHKPYGDL